MIGFVYPSHPGLPEPSTTEEYVIFCGPVANIRLRLVGASLLGGRSSGCRDVACARRGGKRRVRVGAGA